MTSMKCGNCSAIYPATDSICPSCMRPPRGASFLAKPIVKIVAVSLVVVLLMLWFFVGSKESGIATDVSDARVVSDAFSLVRTRLKDPDSAIFGHTTRHLVSDGKNVACGTVNSKNGFGGYSGEKRFVYMYEQHSVSFDDGSPDFSTLWRLFCR